MKSQKTGELVVVLKGKATDKQVSAVENLLGFTATTSDFINGNTDIIFHVSPADYNGFNLETKLNKYHLVESFNWNPTALENQP